MANDRTNSSDYTGPLRRLLLAVLIYLGNAFRQVNGGGCCWPC